MIRRPPRSTLDRSSAASDVYKRQVLHRVPGDTGSMDPGHGRATHREMRRLVVERGIAGVAAEIGG